MRRFVRRCDDGRRPRVPAPVALARQPGCLRGGRPASRASPGGRHRGGRLRRRRGLHGAVDGALPVGGRPGSAGRRPRGGDRRLRCERTQRRLVLGALPRLRDGARAPARPGGRGRPAPRHERDRRRGGAHCRGGGHRRALAAGRHRGAGTHTGPAGTSPRRGRLGRRLRRRRRPGPARRRRGEAPGGSRRSPGRDLHAALRPGAPRAAGARARAGRRAQGRGDPRADPGAGRGRRASWNGDRNGAGPPHRAGHRGVDGGPARPPPLGRARLLAHGRDRAPAGPVSGPVPAWPRARRSRTTGTW